MQVSLKIDKAIPEKLMRAKTVKDRYSFLLSGKATTREVEHRGKMVFAPCLNGLQICAGLRFRTYDTPAAALGEARRIRDEIKEFMTR